jgi:hypothetical protein
VVARSSPRVSLLDARYYRDAGWEPVREVRRRRRLRVEATALTGGRTGRPVAIDSARRRD